MFGVGGWRLIQGNSNDLRPPLLSGHQLISLQLPPTAGLRGQLPFDQRQRASDCLFSGLAQAAAHLVEVMNDLLDKEDGCREDGCREDADGCWIWIWTVTHTHIPAFRQ